MAAELKSTEEGPGSLEGDVVRLMSENNLTLCTAESCTGGMLGARIVNVPGASDVFKAGFVTYSNKAKRKFLNVKKKTLKVHGAVSEKTAKEMAKGAMKAAGTDAAVSTTGIAGPGGGTPEKPVGLVYICAVVGKRVCVKECRFSGSRSEIRQSTVETALTMLRTAVMDEVQG